MPEKAANLLPAETTVDSPRAKAAKPQSETAFELRPLGARVTPAETVPSDEPGYTVPILRPVPRPGKAKIPAADTVPDALQAAPEQPAALPEGEPGGEEPASSSHDTVADLRALAPRRQG